MDLEARLAAVEEFLSAADAGDSDGTAAFAATDFVLRTPAGLPLQLGGRFEGREAFAEFYARRRALFELVTDVESVAAVDDDTVQVRGVHRGTCRATGRALDASFVDVVRWEGNRIADVTHLADTAAWVAAAAGAEKALAPPFPAPEKLTRFRYDVTGGIARIVLDRPASRNALDLVMAEDLLAIVGKIEADPSIRAVLLTATGSAFCVGGDIEFFRTAGSVGLGALSARMAVTFHEALRRLSRIEAPIIAAVQGSVVGAGLGIACSADIVIAADDASFSTVFSGIGLAVDSGLSWQLPRMVGSARASRMFIENLTLDAATACDWGLVGSVVPAADLADAVELLATRLAAGPTIAYALQRRLLRESWGRTLGDQLDAETEAARAAGATSDAAGAVRAFLNRERPQFEGR